MIVSNEFLLLRPLHFPRDFAKPFRLIGRVLEYDLGEIEIPVRTEVCVQFLKNGSANGDFNPVDLFHYKRPERAVKLVDLSYFFERGARPELPVPIQETGWRILHERQGIAAEAEVSYRA